MGKKIVVLINIHRLLCNYVFQQTDVLFINKYIRPAPVQAQHLDLLQRKFH